MAATPTIAQARRQSHPDSVYLNTASFGLPPDCAWEAHQQALADWRFGRTSWEDWGHRTDAARAAFAALVGVPASTVATGATVSGLVGLVAASIPDRSRVLIPDVEFASTLFPFLVQAGRGVRVRVVPPAELAGEVDARTDVVAFSAVQMSSGEVADLDAIAAAARAAGAITVLDATQACGWLPIDAKRFDYVACAAYKWLLCPRGTAFMAIRPERLEAVRPNAAGWYAGEDVWSSIYGGPLRLAASARRLDVSPAWLCWVGTVPSLELIERVGVEAIQAHDVALANRLREGLGMPSGDSAIVCVDAPRAHERLAAAGIRASSRAGAARLAFHLHNTPADADRALEALTTAP
jgi:selenocysteine lyase/cysteine desulfurase